MVEKSKGGMYHSASEVIRQALRAFIESENQKDLRIRLLNKEIDIGLADLAQGNTVSGGVTILSGFRDVADLLK